MKAVIWALFLIGALSACASLVDKGDKLFEAGEYEDAADFYLRAVSRDPNNIKATIGLNKAREKIIDRGLISVRMLRLASNPVGATQKLEEILKQQQDWGIAPVGAVAATQQEETRFARSWLASEGRRLTDGPHPDQYRFFETQYSQLIAGSAALKKQFAQGQAVVLAKAKTKCRGLASQVSGQRFFLQRFTQKYCAMWQIPVTLKVDAVDRSRYKHLDLKQDISVIAEHGNIRARGVELEVAKLTETFRDSIWYADAAQRALAVSATTAVKHSRSARNVKRFANYTLNKTTKSKNSEGEEVVSVQKTDKIHEYRARVYREELTINMTLKSEPGGKPVLRNHNFADTNSTEAHNEEFPLANLHSRSPSFMNLSQIFAAQLNILQRDFLTALDEQWEKKYCQAVGSGGLGENSLRCAALRPEHGFAATWFTSAFGLNYGDLMSLVGN
ncbi:MAG: hypothetical protein KTR17_03825 [Cellvibrionaceae bacterium]|nr:hypothetical protein [Cellvibrionaceae bacterium]